ncbi:TolC family protein [Acinetobacter nectaris]|uniref:TolC family protein n=1 Tax=Acinetobacter nectaris TaxID=1219382 RepID=UPI001F01E2F6|nr:TolC family protein [Acinetobacter nectaris]MCF9000078.1 TolC family protein [Acinetobacter nectaris]MCF9027032.1 TolC family protein [Acinetobacter nectaris]
MITRGHLNYLIRLSLIFPIVLTHADSTMNWKDIHLSQFIQPQPNDEYKKINIATLSKFTFQPEQKLQENISLPIVGRLASSSTDLSSSLIQNASPQQMTTQQAVLIAVQRNPNISQSLATLAEQNANIDYAKTGYYPQLSAGLTTGNFNSSNRGQQVYTIKATQLLYDFGKVKSGVDLQKAKLITEQANTLASIDDIATETSRNILALLYYRHLVAIAQQQITGMQRLYEIALLRSKAGISSKADPVQAESYVTYAQSYLISQQSNVRQTEQKLKTLLGIDVSQTQFNLPTNMIQQAGLYDAIAFNNIPKMIEAQAEISIATAQKQQAQKSIYPTVSLVGSVNSAVNGINPDTGKRNDTDTAIYLSVSSNFYQGGQTRIQQQAADYAEQAAQAKLNATYLDILDTTRTSKAIIDNTQQQISFLDSREQSTKQTRVLYEDQYKLGTRSILDLVSAEQSYHSAQLDKAQAIYSIDDTLAKYINTTGKARLLYQLNNMNIQGVELQP